MFIFDSILAPLIGSMRDAKRLLASLPVTLRTTQDEIELSDLLALETLRVLAPELHDLLDPCGPGLTTLQGSWTDPAEYKAQVDRFVAADSRGGWLARAVIENMFPAGMRHLGGESWAAGSDALWQSQGLVAAGPVLDYYLTKQLPNNVAPSTAVSHLINSFTSLVDARRALASIPDDKLEDVLERLIPFSESADPAVVPVAVRVLLEQLPRLREEPEGFLDFGAELLVTRPIWRLLLQLPVDEVYPCCTDIANDTPTLFGAFELATLVGHRENAGHKLVSEDEAKQLESLVLDRVQRADPVSLAGERQLLGLLYHTLLPAEDATEPALPAMNDVRLAAAVLRAGVTTSRSQNSASRRVHLKHSFSEIAVRLLGGSQGLERAVQAVTTALADGSLSSDPRLDQALNFGGRYIDGWRPSKSPFDGDE